MDTREDDFGDESITRNRAARTQAVMLLARHSEAAAYLHRLEQRVEDLHREILRAHGDLLHVRAQVWAEGCLVGMSDEAERTAAYTWGTDWAPSPNPYVEDREAAANAPELEAIESEITDREENLS